MGRFQFTAIYFLIYLLIINTCRLGFLVPIQFADCPDADPSSEGWNEPVNSAVDGAQEFYHRGKVSSDDRLTVV